MNQEEYDVNSVTSTEECDGCGVETNQNEKTNKHTMKKIALIVCVLLAIVCFVVIFRTMNRSPYYISEPKESRFNEKKLSELSFHEIYTIKDFIPRVVKWYNSIDIQQTYNVDTFISEDTIEMGEELFYNVEYQNGIDLLSYDKEEFDQIAPVNAIYGSIAGVIINSELQIDISNSEELVIQIDEDSWIELKESITNAIEYYYN